jgi:general secretion pathway protein D
MPMHLLFATLPSPGRPAFVLSTLAVSLILAGCVTPSGNLSDGSGPSQLVVHTADSQGARREPAARAVQPARAAAPQPLKASQETNRPTRADATDAAPPVPASGGPLTMLNFVNADLPGVVSSLARFTGRNFVVDPRVKGQLTLVSEAPVDAATAYGMLLGALRMQGFAVVDVNGVNRVVPEADAKLQGVGVTDGSAPASGELLTRVFQLRYENAANLVPILRPMIAPNNTINAYANNNTLVITDYADNLARIAQVIAGIDTPDSLSTDVVPIRHGVALDVAALVSQMLNQRGAGEGAHQTVVLADPRSNAVLLRATSPERLELARKLVHRIDSPETREGNLNVVYLRNAQATRLAEVLRGALTGLQNSGRPGGAGESIQAGALSEAPLSDAMNPSGSGIGLTPAGQFGAGTAAGNAYAQGMTGTLRQAGVGAPVAFTAGGATVQADPATNTLLISAPPPLYRTLREVIDQLDQRRAQVLVESLIVEVNEDKAAEFGIQWMLGGNNISGNDSNAFLGGANFGGSGIRANGVSTIDALGQGLSLGVVRGTVNILGNEVINLGVLARAMQSTGGVNVLSTPNLMTLDNEEASIVVGRTVPFVTGQYTTSADGASNPFQTVTREDVGLTLRIRPQVSEGGAVKLALYQEVSSIDPAASDAANALITRKRALDTNVLVDDGQIIVLGGLLEDTISDGTSSVPLLGDIPGIGNLFRYDTRQRTKTNLMVFLRPHIVRDARDSASVTLDRYNYMRAAQGRLPARSTWFYPDDGMRQLPAFETNPATGMLDLRQPDEPKPASQEPVPETGKPPSTSRL